MSAAPLPRLLDGHDPAHVQLAAQALADGRLVALPTETVYGLGANALDDQAVAAIFAAKGRPADLHWLGYVFAALFLLRYALPG